MTLELVLFYTLGGLALASAAALVLARNVVYGVLAMAFHFLVTALLFLVLRATFLAAVQVIVYAGAIMVLFLFVVMLLGNRRLDFAEPLTGQRPVAVVGLVVLAGSLVAAIGTTPAVTERVFPSGADIDGRFVGGFGSAEAVGEALLAHHVLALEVVSVLLLVGMLGALVVGRPARSGP